MNFKSVINQKVEYTGNIYRCDNCLNENTGKPWSIFDLEPTVNICSYLCNKQFCENKDNIYKKLINKEDFNEINPYIGLNQEKEKDFILLSNEEITNLDDEEYKEYCYLRDEYFTFNPEKAKIEQEILDNEELNYLTTSSSEENLNIEDDY